MAAVKYRGVANGKKIGGSTIPITYPATAKTGDFAVIEARSNSVLAVWTTPEGWELLGESTRATENGGKMSLAIFCRKLTGTTGINLPTLKASVEGTLEYTVQVVEAGTYDPTAPIDTHSAGWQESPAPEPLTVTINGGTTTIAGDLILFFLSEAQVPTSNPTGYTKDVEGAVTYAYHLAEAGAGAVNISVTKNTKVVYQGFAVAIKAVPEGALLPMLV